MILYGRIRPTEGDSYLVEAEGADYESARTVLYAMPGEGEILLSISTWPI